MLVKFICNPVHIGKSGWTPLDTRLGGTEESVVNWAKKIQDYGHTIKVYYNGEPGVYSGVEYLDYDDYEPGGIDINIKYSQFKHKAPAYYLTNEVDAHKLDLSGFDGVILPSKWALDHIPVNNKNIKIVPHGYDPEKIYPEQKIPLQCLYASSPDRGLEYLVDFWPKVVEKVPDAQLVVTYGGSIDTPNTTCLGDIDDSFMSMLFRTSQFWLHPCKGYELYCMSAIKAQAAEAMPVYYPVWALKETVRWGIRTKPDNFVDKLVDIMTNKAKYQDIINHAKWPDPPYPTWKISTDILLRAIGIEHWKKLPNSNN